MTYFNFSLTALVLAFIVSCNSTKKGAATTDTSNIIPGEAQVTAIKTKYPDVNLVQLTEGHSIFTGACTNCHKAYNIFKRSEASWLHEIDDMSPKAKLTAAQKDVLTKYILSMKATQVVNAK